MATALSTGVWQFDLGAANAALVDDRGTLTLVDAGTPGSVETLREELAEAGHELADVDRVLVTHFDYDHVGGLPAFDEWDVPIVAGDARLVRGARRPSPTSLKGLLQRLAGRRITPPDNEVRPAGDGLRVGGFTVFESPGHTPRHVSFVHEERSVAIFGDVVRTTDDGFALPPWYLNGDSGQVRASVRSLGRNVPVVDAAIVGHGPSITPAASERFRRFAHGLDL